MLLHHGKPCSVTLRWPQSFGKTYKLSDEGYIEEPAVSVKDAKLIDEGNIGSDAEQLAPVCASGSAALTGDATLDASWSEASGAAQPAVSVGDAKLNDKGHVESETEQPAPLCTAGGAASEGEATPAASWSEASCSARPTPSVDDATLLLQALVLLPWEIDTEGKVIGLKKFKGVEAQAATWQDVAEDATMWQQAFARDVRCLHNGNHDHNCSATCVKYQKKKSKEEQATMLQASKAPPCRFFFYIIVVLRIVSETVERIRRFRRRGKALVSKAFVQATNLHNEYGLVEVERKMPFRSPSQDVALVCLRCNNDYRFMARGVPVQASSEALQLAASGAGHREEIAKLRCDEHELRTALRNVSMHSPDARASRQVARAIVATHVACYNCDYYITKYSCKSLEQLANVVTQYALGIRRLEEDERREAEETAKRAEGAALVRAESAREARHRRARRVTIRLAMAANRSTWVSATEYAVFILTGSMHFSTHNEVPLFLSRAWHNLHACKSTLEQCGDNTVAETAQVPLTAIGYYAGRDTHSAMTSAEHEECDGNEGELGEGSGAGQPAAMGEPDDVVDQASDAGESNEGEDEMIQELRATTTRIDDWLHRGAYLQELTLVSYMRHVARVRKPTTNSGQSFLFLFDEHYELADQYCQAVMSNADALPRFIGPTCPPARKDVMEEHALYKLMLFGKARCAGAGACSDPLMHRCAFLPKSASGSRRTRYCSLPVWRATFASMTLRAQRAEKKLARAQRIPVIADVSLLKTSPSGTEHKQKEKAWLHHLLAKVVEKHCGEIACGIVYAISAFLPSCSEVHDDQLHLDEFVALENKEMNTNLDFQTLAKSKPLEVQKSGRADNETDSEEEAAADNRDVEFMGGGHEEDIDEEEEPENLHSLQNKSAHAFSLQEVKSMLRREEAIARTALPGKHRDMDMQMKSFASLFDHELKREVHFSASREERPLVLGNGTIAGASLHQEQTIKEFRAQENMPAANEARAMLDSSPVEEALERLNRTIAARWKSDDHKEDKRCTLVELGEVWQGPGRVAKRLLEQDLPFTEEHRDVVALIAWAMQQAFVSREDATSIRLPCDASLLRIVVLGGGGCGKTLMLTTVLFPLFILCFGDRGVLRCAPSNKAARHLGGKTVHSLKGLRASASLRTAQLRFKSDAERRKMEATHTEAGVECYDECSQIQGALLHAGFLRSTYARAARYRLRVGDYALPAEVAGRISILMMLGDPLQLPPVPITSSLFADPAGTSDEQKAGTAMFGNIDHVYVMEQMLRFKDDVLVKILEKMRQKGGARLTQAEWSALQATAWSQGSAAESVGAAQPDANWYHSSFLWSVVSMAAYLQAKASAQAAQRMLYYVQAVDVPSQRIADPALFKEMLAEPNLNKTAKLPALLLFHIGMRMKVTQNVCPPWLVQDTAVTVVDVHFNHYEKPRRENVCEQLLEFIPDAIFVKIDDCNEEFLPRTPCSCHEDFAEGCPECRRHPGVFMIRPTSRSWLFDSKNQPGVKRTVHRISLPLMPYKACSLYSLQGTTAQPGLIAHFTMPTRLGDGMKWLIVYVLLSRVPSLAQLRSIGLDDQVRGIIEKGPPGWLLDAFDKLVNEKLPRTKAACAKARASLGW